MGLAACFCFQNLKSQSQVCDSRLVIVPSETARITATASARTSDSSNAAVTLIRSRLVPLGTVGGRIAATRNCCCSTRFPARTVSSGSPRMTGMIGPLDRSRSGSPNRVSSSRSRSLSACSLVRRSGSASIRSNAVTAAAQTAGGNAVEKTCVREEFRSQSTRAFDPATNPPSAPTALLSVPIRTPTRSSVPVNSHTPRPVSPKTPVPCASSTITVAP